MPERAHTPPLPHTPRRTPTGDRVHAVSPGPFLSSPFVLQAASRATQCPPPPPDLREPSAFLFAYGLTLPSATGTPGVAQGAAEVILDTHGVEDDVFETAAALVGELALHACRFTGAGEMIHLVVRCTGDTIQAIAHDTHAPHFHPRLAAQCDERRSVSLITVRELVAEHQGEWGFTAAQPPASGMCTWATLTCRPKTPPAPDAAAGGGTLPPPGAGRRPAV